MSIVKRNHTSLPFLMDEIFGPDWFGGKEARNHKKPPVNIREVDAAFELEVIVPGRKKEDFRIEVDKDILTIASEQKEIEETAKTYTRQEFAFVSFNRAFTLPETVDTDSIEATYEAGILKVVLRKKEEALPKPKRAITIG
ncbi:Hsp20/alpha crystallin family protein [Spongiimicrobium salis]|uniref:Hsp20/alpha crystallin family protein n=1 Tax=Spongiimicrobium salis TaxID=1667022 RepID=UPI00374CEFD3